LWSHLTPDQQNAQIIDRKCIIWGALGTKACNVVYDTGVQVAMV
jgi:hypothetical protein